MYRSVEIVLIYVPVLVQDARLQVHRSGTHMGAIQLDLGSLTESIQEPQRLTFIVKLVQEFSAAPQGSTADD